MLFGQWLVKRGLVSVEQVQLALKHQTVHGGRLGTNLLVQGSIDLDSLTAALGEWSGVPVASPELFEHHDVRALQAVTGELAAKHKAFPLAFSKQGPRELSVAFRDPEDINARDEIAFAAGARVKPMIAPELVIHRSIERAYRRKVPLEFTAINARASLVPHERGPREVKPRAASSVPMPPAQEARPAPSALSIDLTMSGDLTLSPTIEFVTFDQPQVQHFDPEDPLPFELEPEVRPPKPRAKTTPPPVRAVEPVRTVEAVRTVEPLRAVDPAEPPVRAEPPLRAAPPVRAEPRAAPSASMEALLPARMHEEIRHLRELQILLGAPESSSEITAASLLPPEEVELVLTEVVSTADLSR